MPKLVKESRSQNPELGAVTIVLIVDAFSAGLRDTVSSIRWQFFSKFDVQVICRCRDNRPPSGVPQAFDGDQRFSVQFVESDSNLLEAVKSLVIYAAGDYVCVVWKGELWCPEKLLTQVAALQGNSELDGVSSSSLYALKRGSALVEFSGSTGEVPSGFGDEQDLNALTGYLFRTPSLLKIVCPTNLRSERLQCGFIRRSLFVIGHNLGANSRVALPSAVYLRSHTDVFDTWRSDSRAVNQNVSTKSDSPVVSVVVPVYNAERFIKETLDCIIGQSYPSIEIIVVDDCSTDASVQHILNYNEKHRNIQLIRSEKNAGVCVARNRGINAAQSDFVMCVDADDLLDEFAVSRLVLTLSNQPEGVMAFGATVRIDGDSMVSASARILLRPPTEGPSQGFVYSNLVGHGSGILFRRDAALRFGGYDESMRNKATEGAADWLFYIQLSAIGKYSLYPVWRSATVKRTLACQAILLECTSPIAS